MNSIQNIISDLDGTLLNDEGILSENTKKYFQFLNGKVDVILVSGRSIERILPFAKQLNIQNNKKPIVIGLGGNLVYFLKSKKYKYFKEFDEDEIINILQCPSFLNQTIYGYTAKKTYVFKDKINSKERIKNLIKICLGKKQFVLKKTNLKKHLLKFQIFANNSTKDLEAYNIKANVCININEIEILPKGVDKMTAISSLLLSSKNNVYFGDSDNDIPCLSFFENSVAVKNASTTAKKHSKIILNKTNNEDGVIQYLKEVLHFENQ